MCPALMLAISRTDNVIGRTMILIVSIITRNGFKRAGAPIGSKPAITDLGLKKIAEIIRDNHKGSPRDSEILKCLVGLNTYGINPLKFIKIISRNKALRILMNPAIFSPNVREISEDNVFLNVFIKTVCR
jgi:hypothetical protein